MRNRQSNQPDRRIAPIGTISAARLKALGETASYVGSGNHKLHSGDYGFVPSHNPRPSKSPCDGIRSVLRAEATHLFLSGISKGMVSAFEHGSFPKYVWALDEAGEVYEAKTKPEQDGKYHGYRIGDDEKEMRRYVRDEWNRR